MAQHPGVFRRAEIRRERQARFLPHARLPALLPQPGGNGRRPPALPDNCRTERFAGFPVPTAGCFALVGKPQNGDVGGGDAGRGERFARRSLHALPDLREVVADPALAADKLAVRYVRPAEQRAVKTPYKPLCALCALIDRENDAHARRSSFCAITPRAAAAMCSAVRP